MLLCPLPVLEDIDQDHQGQEKDQGRHDTDEDYGVQAQHHDHQRQEEEHDNEVGDGEPAVVSGGPAQNLAHGDWYSEIRKGK